MNLIDFAFAILLQKQYPINSTLANYMIGGKNKSGKAYKGHYSQTGSAAII
jgi:hypothetical protein